MFILLAAGFCLNGFFSLSQKSVADEMSMYIARNIDAGAATVAGLISIGASLVTIMLVAGLTPIIQY